MHLLLILPTILLLTRLIHLVAGGWCGGYGRVAVGRLITARYRSRRFPLKQWRGNGFQQHRTGAVILPSQ